MTRRPDTRFGRFAADPPGGLAPRTPQDISGPMKGKNAWTY